MFGVLYVDIETALKSYEHLVGKVFAGSFPIIRAATKGSRYSSAPLRDGIDEALEKHGKDRKFMEDPERDKGCRVFVTTTLRSTREVILVRSYKTQKVEERRDHGHQWRIRSSCLSTAAAPLYFKPYVLHIDQEQFEFEDAGAHGKNNPTELAWAECQILPDLNEGPSLYISIGTGKAPIKKVSGLFSGPRDALNAVRDQATDVEEPHERMEQKKNESPNMSYFRLNPDLEENIDLADSKQLPNLKCIASEYNLNNWSLFDEIAEKLQEFQP